MVRTLVGRGASLIAFRSAVVSTSNGSPESSPVLGGVGRPAADPGRGAPACGRDGGAGVFPELLDGDAPEEGRAAPGAGPGFLGAAAVGLPDIEAPQNGQSSTSSSKTEALQAGQLRNSIVSLHT